MEFVIHAPITAVALLLVSKFLRGFEIDSLFTAIVTALILGLLHALIAPWMEHFGRLSARLIGAASLSYPVAICLIVLSMLAVNAMVLKLAAAVGPGFRISDFKTAIFGALLLAIFNAMIGAGIDFAGQLLSVANSPTPG